MQALRKKLGGGSEPYTFEFSVVAQHATELPLPSGARAHFLLKRRSRLCVTEPEAVDGTGGVEWNTSCVQTATLFKDGDAWRPKEFVFKVQRVLDNPRLGQEAAQTVARAALDLSQFCTAEPFGPKQLVVPLQPAGVLHVSIRTQWLANYDAREADAATDISYMSWGQSVATSGMGAPAASEEEQDLSGFDGSSAASLAAASLAGLSVDGGTIRAVYQPGVVAGGVAGAHAAALEAPTPVMFGAGAARPGVAWASQQPHAQQQQQDQQHPAAVGLPPEAWSPIDLQEAVQQLYDSEEEPTPRASVLGTVKRMFGRARNTNLTPPATTARQLHETFSTPRPTPHACTPNFSEIATIDREASLSALRRTCKRLVVERDEARAEGFAEAALAVEQGLEIDRLRRTKDGLLLRLRTAEEQLLATYRDEAATDLIQALAEARVEAAQRDFEIMELQGQVRKKDGLIDKLRAQLTRAEAKYRARLDAAHSPGPLAAALSPASRGLPPSPWRDEADSPAAPQQSQAGSSVAVGAMRDSPAALEVRPLGSPAELAA
ncbi:hypothetical protein COHA_007354 [Chlorella ohadii]|uniref:C2 NT-type domain-containing protein n=1 Tax=Chlorella ohadii TaxID=2649997 RepID=A0AAD5DR28_9CHLO|nr:hypothetical protein COHA_007354 [Chlorella ohadii]